MKFNIIHFQLAVLTLSMGHLYAQDEIKEWQHFGGTSQFPTGIGSADWYQTAKPSTGKRVVVAVLDSGIDILHPDLKDNIWINEDEIADNKIDDDKNGYIDDIHGWNFIGGPDGRNVTYESLEVTREYAKERSKWEGVDPEKLKGKSKKEYQAFAEKETLIIDKQDAAREVILEVEQTKIIVMDALAAAKAALPADTLDLTILQQSSDERVQMAASIIKDIQDQGIPVESIEWLEEIAIEQFDEQLKDARKDLDYAYNPDFNSREIVGDQYNDFSNRSYGNNDVNGAFAYHGTHVAGIIGAIRNNDEGMDGIADQVAIMAIRLVPDGDERDKDVANGIRYAVDNGAQVINMSFGKGYSPEKNLVDDAMRYAEKHDVLLVLGAGNEGTNLDEDPKFPNDTYQKKSLFGPKGPKNLISVGALSFDGGESAVAEFSNYGKKEVDVFAPGVYIYSTVPDSAYDYASGTSMASPVVAGLATMIRSRYPLLTASQVKDIIIKSTRDLPSKLIQPGTFETVTPKAMCISGGMVDIGKAMTLAAQTKGKKKAEDKAHSSTPITTRRA